MVLLLVTKITCSLSCHVLRELAAIIHLPFSIHLLILDSHPDPPYQGLSTVQECMVSLEETVYIHGAISNKGD